MRRVVKIGGSLVTRPTLIEDVDRWFARQSPADNYVIVGGGEMIDAVRRWDQIHGLPAQSVHWQCVELLNASFLALRSWFPDWQGLASEMELHASLSVPVSPRISLVRCESFYHRGSSFPGVPTDWRTTTDSIAVLLARIIEADEVVLLKSCVIPQPLDLQAFSDAGIVDQALPHLAQSVPVRIETLARLNEFDNHAL
jgi:5-(aminomethyl)-3-furanmethanol phosphate kinase